MYNHGLPVPADMIVDGSWLQDPYQASLPVPQKQVFQQYPQLAWVLNMTAATLVAALQENCQSGPISAFAYNLFSQNQYNNNYWLTIVDDASDFAIQQIQANQSANAQQVVNQAVRFYATYATAACVPKWQALAGFLDQNMMAKVQQVIGQWNQLSGGVQAGMYTPQPQQRANPWGNRGGGDVAQFASNNAALGATNMGNLGFNAAQEQENSKFGGSKRAVPNARRPAVDPELADLGVMESSSQSNAGKVASEPPLVVQGTIAPPRPRPRPRPTANAGLASTHPEAQVQNIIQGEQQRQQAQPSYMSEPMRGPNGDQIHSDIPDDIPALDIFGDDDAWVDRLDERGGHTIEGNFERADGPRDEYRIDKPGRFLVRPKNLGVDLPSTRADAELEEAEDLEILEVASEPVDGDLTVLELEDGQVAVQCMHDDSRRTWSESMPHNFPYDPLKFQRYLIEESATNVYEAFLPRDPDVNYEDLEFDGAARAKARQTRLSDKRILADLSLIQEITPRSQPYTVIGATEHLDKASKDADQTKHLDEVQKFQGKLSVFEFPEDAQELDETLYDLEQFFGQVQAKNTVAATFGFTERRFYAPGIATRVKSLNESQAADRLAKLLLFVRELQDVNARAYSYLNERLLVPVMNTVDHATGFDMYTINSLAEDFFTLTSTIEQEHGSRAFDAVNKAADRLLGSVQLSYSEDTLTIRETYGVLGLPVGMASFNLSLVGDVYHLTTGNAPELNMLIDQLGMEKGKPQYYRLFLSGADGDLFEVIESVWDDAFKTLKQVK